MNKRIAGLDVLRGLGIMFVVFLHSALFQYKNITDIDFADPPLVVTLIGFLLMWAGFFAIISMMANTGTALRRTREGGSYPVMQAMALSGLFMFLLSYVYFLFLGPPLLDLEAGRHQYSLVHGLLKGLPPVLHADRFFYVNALTMIGLNLILLAPLLHRLLKVRRAAAHYRALLCGAGGVLLLSLLRLPLYPLYQEVYRGGSFLAAFFLGLLVNKNNPILPFLAFGLLGILMALWLLEAPAGRRPTLTLGLLGVFCMAAAFLGLKFLPDTMLERDIDLFWYFLTIMQMGLFILLTTGAVAFFDLAGAKGAARTGPVTFVRRFGRVSLTIFLLETPLAEITARAWDLVYPGWNESMVVAFAYAGLNLVLWAAILVLWQRFGFKYSLEWLSARMYARLGRQSDKGDMLENLGIPRETAA